MVNIPDCIICADTMKKPVTCVYCNQTACLNCWKTFFKVVAMSNPKCIFNNCKQEWNSILMYKHLGAPFMKKEYKDIKKNILFQQEQAQIPETLKFIPNYRLNIKYDMQIKDLDAKVKDTQNQLEKKRTEYIEINTSIKNGYHEFVPLSLQIIENINALERLVVDYKKRIKEIKSKRINGLTDIVIENENNNIESGYKFHCPVSGCNGFFYTESERDTCIVCNNKVCKTCETLIKRSENGTFEKHTCDPDVLANISLLKNDSKPCPKCNCTIFKISGCDQMYCTRCKCCFSWNTGEIYNTGSIHNPHYFNELRQGGAIAQIGRIDDIQIPCEQRMIDTLTVSQIIKKIQLGKFKHDQTAVLFTLVQKMVEIKSKIVAGDVDNTKLRVSFICNELTKDEFCQKIYLKDLDFIKKNEFNHLYNLYITVCDDQLKRLLVKETTFKQCMTYIDSFKNLINGHLKELSSIFGIKKVELV